MKNNKTCSLLCKCYFTVSEESTQWGEDRAFNFVQRKKNLKKMNTLFIVAKNGYKAVWKGKEAETTGKRKRRKGNCQERLKGDSWNKFQVD